MPCPPSSPLPTPHCALRRGHRAAFRPALCRLSLAAVLLLLTLSRPATAQSPSIGAAFGDTLTYRGCLKFTAVTYSDRQDTVDNHDWLAVRVRNECSVPLRNLLVELNLIDFEGHVYGDQVWLLDRTHMLLPRMTRLERYAIPDPDQRVAVRWGVRIVNLETNSRRVPVRRTAKKADKAPFCILGFCL